MTLTTSAWPVNATAQVFLGPVIAFASDLDTALDRIEREAEKLGANWVLALEPSFDLETGHWSAVGTAVKCANEA
jgi:uncharacterized protein YbjQ (UPF0145 family)